LAAWLLVGQSSALGPAAMMLDVLLYSDACFSLTVFARFDCACRPDGTKKAFIRLTPDFDALDVANRIGII
jgi:hypothetical protein